MRVLFVGDVFGPPGLRAVGLHLPDLRPDYDLIIINGENSAGGKGLSRSTYQALRTAGADLITLGNHAWDQREVYDLLEAGEPIIRAHNYPPGTPGKGWWRLEARGETLLVVQVLGRLFMDPLDDPFRSVDSLLTEESADYVLLEVHAEATSEKMALGYYFDGRVSAVLGTHTHVATADCRFLPQGTAFQTDVGMTGPLDSIIGGEVESFLSRFLTGRPAPFRSAQGPARFHATELILEGGRCQAIRPLVWDEPESQA